MISPFRIGDGWSGEREAWSDGGGTESVEREAASDLDANAAAFAHNKKTLHALRYTLHGAAWVLTPEKPKSLIYEFIGPARCDKAELDRRLDLRSRGA